MKQQGDLTLQLRKEAERIFGSDQKAIENWVEYWAGTRARNQQLVESFGNLVLLDFSNKSVLDVGCGTGGLGQIINSDARYTGLDYHLHVLRWAEAAVRRSYLQGSASQLPFADKSFDFVFAFDVVEHLIGGKEWQLAFFAELKRVLRPLGMIFLTTPNFWYPYDAHSRTYGPQFLPVRLADAYIRYLNPAFIAEHGSFRNIQLMTPRFFKRCVETAELACLHDLPCGLDRAEYRKLHAWAGPLGPRFFAWYSHAEFWPILVHQNE
ncbi:MAG TPA: class I SAM-dependent methyltransferase, partial [Acidobacteriota bacterium]|nr:class I SAM-dependent methyltransferase [Acidobacteriota bacterium]